REAEGPKVHVRRRPVGKLRELVRVLRLEIALIRVTQKVLRLRPKLRESERRPVDVRPLEREVEGQIVGSIERVDELGRVRVVVRKPAVGEDLPRKNEV